MPIRPSNLADVPQAIEDVLLIGMAKDPERRFQTVTELADAYANAAVGSSDAIAARAARLASEHPWAA
jgi:hypothetical protein